MSYSQTLVNRKNNSSYANELATSTEANTYTRLLRNFVYGEVIKIAKRRSKNDSFRFDIDSKDLLKTAINLADSEFTRRSLVQNV
ncbi:hypothetical protein [Candidatus Nitrosocosmicus hydrocola]|uniref:hypothetical protein n=1 Tax=Candidatus Nitrosocosmicus hydrocola TaxID=1826872 RepID=UPI0011E5EFBE|nr:hypothetical protein [Candidatus Nitrosocosmicus hydrocola]